VKEMLEEPSASPTEPMPWYRGYGTNHKTVSVGDKWIFEGQVQREARSGDTALIITEIPIFTSIDEYKEKVLGKLLEEKKIEGFEVDHIDENTPRFRVKLSKNDADDESLVKLLKLRRSESKKNMNLLDSKEHYQLLLCPGHYTSLAFREARSARKEEDCVAG